MRAYPLNPAAMLRRFAAAAFLLAAAAQPAAAQPAGDVETWTKLGDEYATGQIEQLSPANKALFVDATLGNVTSPQRLYYTFTRRSIYEDDFTDQVHINVNRLHSSGRKDLTFRYLNGRKRVRFPPQRRVKSNPIFMLFLERDVREMQRITGGSALFFRTRLRHSLAEAELTPTAFRYGGREVAGGRIVIKPYADSEIAGRLSNYRNKTYTFIISDAIPGGIWRIRAHASDDDEGLISDETLVFTTAEPLLRDG